MAALISWARHNFVDDAVLSGSAVPEFPLANLQIRGLSATYQSPLGTSVAFTCNNETSYYGVVDTTLNTFINNDVYDLVVDSAGGIVIFGNFLSVAGTAPRRVARIAADGTADIAFNTNSNAVALNNVVRCGLYDPATFGYLVAGDFTTLSGATFQRAARLRSNGLHDAAFANPSINNTVYSVALHPLGGYLIGGVFTTVGGASRARLARVDTSGALMTTPNIAMPAGAVHEIAPLPTGDYLVGGSWATIGGHASSGIARIKSMPSDAVDTTFTQSVTLGGSGGTVYTIAVQPDGRIIIGGSFSAVGGVGRSNIARLHAGGALDTSFTPPSLSGIVQTVALQPDGKLLVGGSHANYLVRLNADGSLDPTFTAHPNGIPYVAKMLDTGEAYLGGGFTTVDGRNAVRLSRLRPMDATGVARVIALLGLSAPLGTIKVEWRRNSGILTWAELFTERVTPETETVVRLLDQPIPADSIVRITYTSSITGTFTLGRLWIGDALVLPDGIDAGWSMGFRDSGSLDPTDGQQWIESPGVRTRVLSIPLDGARETETVWGFADGASSITNRMSLHALQMECGTTGEVIAVARTGTALWTRHSAVYGHIEQPWQIGHKAGPFWGGALTVIEER